MRSRPPKWAANWTRERGPSVLSPNVSRFVGLAIIKLSVWLFERLLAIAGKCRLLSLETSLSVSLSLCCLYMRVETDRGLKLLIAERLKL